MSKKVRNRWLFILGLSFVLVLAACNPVVIQPAVQPAEEEEAAPAEEEAMKLRLRKKLAKRLAKM